MTQQSEFSVQVIVPLVSEVQVASSPVHPELLPEPLPVPVPELEPVPDPVLEPVPDPELDPVLYVALHTKFSVVSGVACGPSTPQ
jgi:hypothetical protein